MAYRGVKALTPFWEFNKNKSEHPRGLRGYRKFKNGLLNVTPIGEEVDLVQQNSQESPLLRLPAEIRTMIWEFAIDGTIIRPTLQSTNSTYIRSPLNLLRVSRQIYSEAAILVWKLSKFRFKSCIDLESWLIKATMKDRNMIHRLELGGQCYRSTRTTSNPRVFENRMMRALAKLPNVEMCELRLCQTCREPIGRPHGPDRRLEFQEALSSITIDLCGKRNIKSSVEILPPLTCWSLVYKSDGRDRC